MFISKKRWNMIVSDIFDLQDSMDIVELIINHHKVLLDVQEQVKTIKKQPATLKKTTAKKVSK